jgi:hypothetical protein
VSSFPSEKPPYYVCSCRVYGIFWEAWVDVPISMQIRMDLIETLKESF